MKILLLIMLSLPPYAAAQLLFDTAYVVFRGDTTEIWQRGERNCASKFVSDVLLSGDTVHMIQTDTSSLHALCMCPFTMRTTIFGLPAGTYHGIFYFRELKEYFPWLPNDTTWPYATIDFTVLQIPSSPLSSGFRQSLCNGSLDAVAPESQSPVAHDITLSIFPNPFNPETTIEYVIPRTSHVKVDIFTILGQHVKSLVDEVQTAGLYRVRFSTGSLSSGTYICRLQAGNRIASTKFSAIR